MNNCYEIKEPAALIEYLEKHGCTDPYEDFDYQLQTNYGFVYQLKNGQVVFIDNTFRHGGLIFRDKQCFQQTLDSEIFPFENPHKTLYDSELERIRSIHKNIDFYRQHLNKVCKLDHKELTREAAQAYLKKLVGRTIRKLTTDTDLVALIAVFGEIMRRETGGKWMLEKWYGTYNPYFIPRILNKRKQVIHFNDSLLTSIKWKVADADRILDNTEGVMSLKEVNKHHQCIVLEDQ
ncbi:MAG TPA: hypothetical protein VD996_10880 [Chitinophagaceae bacterium]|nr:hypothetical protein [Chitinophagaceae bacterium]